jgi:hypothetical protein
MKTSILSSSLLICLITQGLIAQNYPKAEISNKLVRAVIMLPDAEHGSYQGTRFDWSGIISSLQFSGHSYIGPWRQPRSPKVNDSVSGPAEEYVTSLGYDQVKPGGTFVRIGVGILRKTDDRPFQHFKTYDIVRPGHWSIRKGKNWIKFTQKLASDDGYAYVYQKTLRLEKGKPELVIEHSFKNTGQKTIETDVYSHDFFVIDHEVVGPDVSIQFSFLPKPTSELQHGAEIRGQTLTFTRELQGRESVYTELGGPPKGAHDFSIRIENQKSGAGVQISGNWPLEKVVFWSIRTVACPEIYNHLDIQPGKTTHWKTKFDLYTMKPLHDD